MRNILLLLIFFIFSFNGFSATCSSISRVANAANSVLTSTKYNLDNDTVYNFVNAYDFGCGTIGTLESDALDTTQFVVPFSAPLVGCGLSYTNASTVTVSPCRIGIDNGWTKTTTDSTVAFGCSGCSTETASSTFYVYATTASTTSNLTLKISSTAPDGDGYSGTDRVLGRFYNDSSQNIATQTQNYFGGTFERRRVFLSDIKANGSNGGGSAGTYFTRSLTTITGDEGMATLKSNRIGLQPGTYDFIAYIPAKQVGTFKTRLIEMTGGTTGNTVIYGPSMQGTGNTIITSVLMGRLKPTVMTEYVIQMVVATPSDSGDTGVAGSYDAYEVYTQVMIEQIR